MLGDRVLPAFADTVVIGAGPAGAAVAGLLAERGDQSVLLLEAGPDYGHYESGRWPSDLLDARVLPIASHDWGFNSGATWSHRVLPFERARVIGGCSSHNGCAQIWGSRLDYDDWVARGNPGWSSEELLPLFRAGAARLRVRRYGHAEVTPFQAACLDAAPGAGIPKVADLNDLDENVGIATSPVNIVEGVRWNAAFAYLDPVRDCGKLTIVGDALVDRLLIEGARVEGVVVVRDGASSTIRAGRVVVCAGTYGSPAILLRSGVGDPAALRQLGIVPHVDLPGVGRNLHDHPVGALLFAGTPELERRMADFEAAGWLPEEQTIAKARSAHCGAGFDLHLFPIGGRDPQSGAWRWIIPFSCMTPRSRGAVTLASADPGTLPHIDHGYLSDTDGEDVRVLLDGLQLARALAGQPELAPLLGDEMLPGVSTAAADLAAILRAHCVHYSHPVGTCSMGPANQREAVVDSRGKVHGLDNAYVADASNMPVIPRANTNMPALVIGLRMAGWLS